MSEMNLELKFEVVVHDMENKVIRSVGVFANTVTIDFKPSAGDTIVLQGVTLSLNNVVYNADRRMWEAMGGAITLRSQEEVDKFNSNITSTAWRNLADQPMPNQAAPSVPELGPHRATGVE